MMKTFVLYVCIISHIFSFYYVSIADGTNSTLNNPKLIKIELDFKKLMSTKYAVSLIYLCTEIRRSFNVGLKFSDDPNINPT